jgi:hypothetical protein
MDAYGKRFEIGVGVIFQNFIGGGWNGKNEEGLVGFFFTVIVYLISPPGFFYQR